MIHMAIIQGDYVQGYEHYGTKIRKTKGWVNSVTTNGEFIHYDVRADDHWKGSRGTTLTTELGKVIKIDESTGYPLEQNSGFNVICKNCGEQNSSSLQTVSRHGITMACDYCDNLDTIEW